MLLPVTQEDRLRHLMRSGLGDALVSAGAPQRMLPLALDLAGPGFAELPRLWPLLSQRPAEIMHLADRGRLDLGCRADLVILRADSGALEATICAGRLLHLAGEAAQRFARAGITGRTNGPGPQPMAAE